MTALDEQGLFVARPTAIATYSGRLIEPTNPDPDDIAIEDIAHHLSNQCRFTGATERFYSVAEHCVRVAIMVRAELKLEALLHDASEAYIADIAKPVKMSPLFSGYRLAEEKLERAIQAKFRLPLGPWHPGIKYADRFMFQIEAKCLAPRGVGAHVAGDSVTRDDFGWSPRTAEDIFLEDFNHYWAARERQKENA